MDNIAEFIKAENARLKHTWPQETTQETWLLRHTVKLTEEAGELADQVLGMGKMQRTAKAEKHNLDELGSEVADVIIVAMMIGYEAGVDVREALETKMATIEARYGVEEQ